MAQFPQQSGGSGITSETDPVAGPAVSTLGTRMTAAEGVNTAQNTRLGLLEAVAPSSGLPVTLVSPMDPRFAAAASAITAQQTRFCRVSIPKTGTLRDIMIFVGTVSGNIETAIYSIGAPHTQLWTTGVIACPPIGWQVVGNPALAVTAGDQLDFVIGVDNATATFLRTLPAAGSSTLPTTHWPSPGTTVTKIAGRYNLPGVLPMPATVSEANVVDVNYMPFILGRIV